MLGFFGAVLFRRDHWSQDVPRYFIKSKIILDLMAYIHPVQLGKTVQCDGWEHGLWVKQTWAQVPDSPYINLNRRLSVWEPWCPAPPSMATCTVLVSTSWFCRETCLRWYLNITPESVSKRKKVKSLSCVWLFVTPGTVACQAPPSMGFSRQEYWSGWPFPSPGDLPNPGIEPGSPAL